LVLQLVPASREKSFVIVVSFDQGRLRIRSRLQADGQARARSRSCATLPALELRPFSLHFTRSKGAHRWLDLPKKKSGRVHSNCGKKQADSEMERFWYAAEQELLQESGEGPPPDALPG
jgi:hypothetical protein